MRTITATDRTRLLRCCGTTYPSPWAEEIDGTLYAIASNGASMLAICGRSDYAAGWRGRGLVSGAYDRRPRARHQIRRAELRRWIKVIVAATPDRQIGCGACRAGRAPCPCGSSTVACSACEATGQRLAPGIALGSIAGVTVDLRLVEACILQARDSTIEAWSGGSETAPLALAGAQWLALIMPVRTTADVPRWRA